MGLGYPGGPLIEKMAKGGNKHKIKFSCLGANSQLDFSFSGIKTAVLYYLKDKQAGIKLKKDLAASFQESAINVLVKKSLLACKRKKVTQLLIGGGVAANQVLRQKFLAGAKLAGIDCFFPEINLCMDNAAMIAGFGGCLYKRGARSDLYLNM